MGEQGGRRLNSIQRVWFRHFTMLFVLFFLLFIAFATNIIFTRADQSIASLLDRALTITWSEYNRFFAQSTTTLTVLADSLETGAVPDYKALEPVLNRETALDFWFITDPEGRVVLSSAIGDATKLQSLAAALKDQWRAGIPAAASEIVPLEQVQAYSPALAQRAMLDHQTSPGPAGALVKVVAVPYRNQSREVAGALVTGHIVNNDNSSPYRLAEQIPDSFSTISVGGVRIAGNIASRTLPTFLGKLQTPAHIQAIKAGERYYGRIKLANDLDHLVVSDPIRNARGEVIGALTIGHPSQGMASLKEDAVIYIILSALLCWGAVWGGSTWVAGRWAAPVLNLSRAAKRIIADEVIKPDHLALVGSLPPANTAELDDLQRGFQRMALSLYEKSQEILGYLKELEQERNHLEVRVAEQTMELRNAMIDLRASSNLKSKLLSNTSHELRTPLNSIIGFADMLTDGIYGDLTEAQRNRVQIIADSARYLLRLINDLLEVSLVQQGKMVLERQWVSMGELTDSVLAMIRHGCEQHGVSLTAEVAPDLPEVFVDPTRIKQVLYNVLSNAAKFTPDGGAITFRVSTLADEMVIAVTDTGIGISENDQLYVFDEFFQGENTRHRKQAGFGLGLPLSKMLVELHGGRIALQSVLGEGTTITIHLPQTSADAAGAASAD
ncbi:MAG TPA: ATP-binding protein [Symbiobacteriaceae bacterium]|nr:ATP-binding protein [Symbiobacteriaceae bacterium]